MKAITIDDQPTLLGLMKKIYPPAYAHFWKDDCSWYLNNTYSKANLTLELKDKNSAYYFVYYNEMIAGIFRLISNCSYPPLSDEQAFKVHRIYLDPTIQGKGIGKQLMNYAQQIAVTTHHTIIWLDAMDTHTQAQSFYKNLGYLRAALQRLDFPFLHDKHRPMWFMHKMLSSPE